MKPEFIKSKNLAFFGGAGSGKTELVINIAKMLKEDSDVVQVYDMDQTKPLFRARSAKDTLDESGIELKGSVELVGESAGAPVAVPGVHQSLADEEAWALFDIGGDKTGAKIVGRFSDAFKKNNVQMIYVFNVNRVFTKDPERVREIMINILHFFDLDDLTILINPYLGVKMTPEEFQDGIDRSKALLEPLGLEGSAIFVPESLEWEPKEDETMEVIKTYPYMQKLYSFEFE